MLSRCAAHVRHGEPQAIATGALQRRRVREIDIPRTHTCTLSFLRAASAASASAAAAAAASATILRRLWQGRALRTTTTRLRRQQCALKSTTTTATRLQTSAPLPRQCFALQRRMLTTVERGGNRARGGCAEFYEACFHKYLRAYGYDLLVDSSVDIASRCGVEPTRAPSRAFFLLCHTGVAKPSCCVYVFSFFLSFF
jgi:hypothetical protein